MNDSPLDLYVPLCERDLPSPIESYCPPFDVPAVDWELKKRALKEKPHPVLAINSGALRIQKSDKRKKINMEKLATKSGMKNRGKEFIIKSLLS
jgi:hypothetical protein